MGAVSNESVPKILINNTKNYFVKCNSILAISNRNSFRVLFDEIDSVYFIGKYIYILALEMAGPGNLHCANFVPCGSHVITRDPVGPISELKTSKKLLTFILFSRSNHYDTSHI